MVVKKVVLALFVLFVPTLLTIHEAPSECAVFSSKMVAQMPVDLYSNVHRYGVRPRCASAQ